MSTLPLLSQSYAPEVHDHKDHMHYGGLTLFGFVVVALIVFLLLVWFKPDFVLRERHGKKTCDVDYFVALIGAIVITIIVLVILWLLAYAFC